MPEFQTQTFENFSGLDLISTPDKMLPGKLRRARGVDFSREKGAISIRRGQSAINSTAITIWSPTEGYTSSGDEWHITISTWRFTLVATDTDKSFCTQVWEKEQVQGDTVASTGETIGIFGWEEQNHGATNIPDSSILYSLFASQGIRYQKIGSNLYKDFSELWTGFSNARSQFEAYRPLSDTIIWTFVADSTFMAKTNGSTVVRKWGIAAPSTAPTAAAGSGTGLTGSYRVRYTYLRKVGSAIAHESSPSPVSSAVSLSNQNLSIAAIVPSDDPQVTHIRIYRTLAGGSTYLFDQDITADTKTATSSQADSALGAAVETDNDPPANCNLLAFHYEYAFLDGNSSNPGYLYFSKRFKPESFPGTYYLEMTADDPGRAIVSWAGVLIRFTRDTKYRILGTTPTTFIPVESPSRRGILPGKAWAKSEKGIFYASQDGIFVTDGISDVELSQDIKSIFEGRTIAGNPYVNKSGNHVMAFFRNKLYFGYASETSTEPDYLAVYDFDARGWRIEPMTIRDLYIQSDTDQIHRGSSNGFQYLMEQEITNDAGSNIALDVETGEAAGAGTSTYKQFRRSYVDANTVGGTMTVSLLLDGTSVDSVSLSASSRNLFRPRFNSGRLGMRGSLRFQYTGQQDVRIGSAILEFLQMGR